MAWRTRSLADVDAIRLYLDGFALRVRSAGDVVCVAVLGWSAPARRPQTAPHPLQR